VAGSILASCSRLRYIAMVSMPPELQRLKNKVAIVTGGAHGIGRAITRAFAEAGACVVIADLDERAGRRTTAEIGRAGGMALFARCDVSSVRQVSAVVKLAARQTGRVDILCNNAAYLG